jgi:hypothetical protein
LPTSAGAVNVRSIVKLPASLAVVAVSVGFASGCGSSDKSSSGTVTSSSAVGPAPPNLVGTYATTLTKTDLAKNKAPELSESPAWQLTVTNSGGSGSGHALVLKNKTAGVLEAPDFAVTGEQIVLKHEECATGGTEHFYDNAYRFARSGKKLRFTKVRNGCQDRVAETVLTAEPWTRQGG